MKTKTTVLTALMLVVAQVVMAQLASPVKVTASLKDVSAQEAEIVFAATIQDGWHMYSTNVVEYGPTPTTITVEGISGASLDGPLAPKGTAKKVYE